MTWFALDRIVPERSARTARDHGPVHVHGLGVNPKDQGLFLATHTGLWRVAADDGKATRVAERREDIMGFTVEGSDRFLGSGHPGPARQPTAVTRSHSLSRCGTKLDAGLAPRAGRLPCHPEEWQADLRV